MPAVRPLPAERRADRRRAPVPVLLVASALAGVLSSCGTGTASVSDGGPVAGVRSADAGLPTGVVPDAAQVLQQVADLLRHECPGGGYPVPVQAVAKEPKDPTAREWLVTGSDRNTVQFDRLKLRLYAYDGTRAPMPAGYRESCSPAIFIFKPRETPTASP